MPETHTPRPTRALMIGSPKGSPEFGAVFKRAFAIEANGSCTPLPEEPPIVAQEELATDVAFPELQRPAPVAWDIDVNPFRERTDLVVQGEAQTYGGGPQTTVEVHLPRWSREVRVWGDRHCVLRGGALEFTEPVPFESLPVRMDRAFGGFDGEALRGPRAQAMEAFAQLHPGLGVQHATDFHYPRNPAGIGFHVGRDLARLDGARVPNLEFPFDALSPERMLVPEPEDWVSAPLPASFDWQDQSWFPRVAHVGYAGEANGLERALECERGWLERSVLGTPRFPRGPLYAGFFQSSAAGCSFEGLNPGTHVGVVNMFPRAKAMDIATPRGVPKITIGASKMLKAAVHLAALVIQPSQGRLTQVWSARCPADYPRTPDQLAALPITVRWP